MADSITNEIETEIQELQDVLKDELMKQRELADVEEGLLEQTFTLEKTTEEHREVASATKAKMFWKNFKYFIVGATAGGLILIYLLFIIL
ncbi:hypothetical protein HK407_01g02020 [Ordospora pajunii]|jgi:hypothetical protein|uniref:uncharacterized protein n=1 Tax=Ordospora pajunii TaxID=3039483 RepID=UPI0029526666|nr:uncharacterized protein HK407_01g02020 [Ordospora pajunii]KAH9412307.1 hypothetical protein HK407_01g02020 [Ordospora pajunii]